ncbi:MAG: OmpA family protein [Deltaproteobacteria bacterium]|nr:OmpA family protein [Deltaproteobacteria bacterium]
MRHPRSLLLIVLLALTLLLPAAARADDIDVELDGVVGKKKTPVLTLRVNRKVKSLQLELTSEQGGRASLQRRIVPAGGKLRIPLQATRGLHRWSGTLSVAFADGGDGEMPLSFTTSNAGPLELKARGEREKLLAGELEFGVDRLPVKARVSVSGLGGTVLAEQEQSFGEGDDASALKIVWTVPEGAGEIVKIELKVEDEVGYHNGIAYFPWQVVIPHEEVIFASGKSEITAEEAPKLEAVLEQIREMARKYGSTGDATLWIAGHTDTVAAPDFNQKLSEARALAIGRYFTRKGITLPIRYRGFGESALAVATPDETDEAANRRAEYVIAAEDPYVGRAVSGSWKKLR